MTLSLGMNMTFKDHYQFLGSSLATLAKYLEKSGLEWFVNLRKQFPAENEKDRRLLLRKGIYPYEYKDCLEKMNEEHFTPKEGLYLLAEELEHNGR